MNYFQTEISLKPRSRGFHLITKEIIIAFPEIEEIKTGLLHVHIKHTSASLTINENADPTVREDFETHFNLLVSEEETHYQHTFEGPEDMTSHIKASLLGPSVTIPITNGRLNLGTWQGVYLCEHRNHGGGRQLVLTAHGN